MGRRILWTGVLVWVKLEILYYDLDPLKRGVWSFELGELQIGLVEYIIWRAAEKLVMQGI